MRAMAQSAKQRPPARVDRSVSPPVQRLPLTSCPLPHPVQRPRLIRALLGLYRMLFVQPVGRRAREERLCALPDRILHDIGLRRADVQAAVVGMVRLSEVMRYPSAGPLYLCGRPGFRPMLVRLNEAA